MKKWLGLFGKKESRTLEDPSVNLGDARAVAELWGLATESGITINKDTALTLSSVWSCVTILSETMGSLSCNLINRTDDGKKEVAYMNPLYNLVHDEPNGYMSRFDFFMLMTTCVCLDGNGYALIIRDHAYRVSVLLPLKPSEVTPVLHNGQMWYFVTGYSKPFPASDILHFKKLTKDGVKGISPIDKAREDMSLGIVQRKFGSKFFKNGANLKGVLESDKVLKEDAYLRLKDSFAREFAGVENSHKTPLLEGGTKYKALSIAPEAAQFLQSRKFSNTEVCRWYRVPPHMVGDLERATNNNIEQQSTEFVMYSIMPWAVMYESELKRKLIPESKKGSQFFKFNLNALLRGDIKSRGEFYSKMFAIGVFSPNDILELEDRNTYKDGDRRYVQGAYIPVDLLSEKLIVEIQKNQKNVK